LNKEKALALKNAKKNNLSTKGKDDKNKAPPPVAEIVPDLTL
jgi:hypothetical protein